MNILTPEFLKPVKPLHVWKSKFNVQSENTKIWPHDHKLRIFLSQNFKNNFCSRFVNQPKIVTMFLNVNCDLTAIYYNGVSSKIWDIQNLFLGLSIFLVYGEWANVKYVLYYGCESQRLTAGLQYKIQVFINKWLGHISKVCMVATKKPKRTSRSHHRTNQDPAARCTQYKKG